ncbi:transcriptional regulator [Erysipelothrix larvae]|uniref:Copper-sensing transcriptional repressor CsoR n=1 Tax=Erysipelothrix larvae TaxID=1514105 RepID=A0A0X8H0U4_9FIRM|nr:metal-sensing transcriptional repressor [Erysipelothrix larvae]AMC93919.1 transcriptional regulator [Erysipelothrix larvae]
MNEKKEAMKYLKTAQGQLNAAISMLDEERYCVDVSHQILASIALLKKANEKMLKQHMTNCVVEAFETDQGEAKIDEVLKLVNKMIG